MQFNIPIGELQSREPFMPDNSVEWKRWYASTTAAFWSQANG